MPTWWPRPVLPSLQGANVCVYLWVHLSLYCATSQEVQNHQTYRRDGRATGLVLHHAPPPRSSSLVALMGQVDSSDLLIYTRPETEVIVSSLHTAKDGLALWNFYQKKPYLFTDPSYASECLLFGYVFALFSTKHYEMMFKIITESNFDKRHFKDLHEYWFEGHYHQYMEKTKKPYLTSIMKFRVRAKNPVPSSIFDEAMKWGTRQSVQKELLKAYEGTSFYFGVEELAKKTGHTKKQVSNWFKNRRSRDRRKEQDEFLQNYYNMDACTSRLVEDTSLYPPNIYHSG